MKKLVQFFILIIFLLLQKNAISQSNGTGAIFLSSAEYAQLPSPNWDTLRKYSLKNSINQSTISSNSISSSNAGITMLVSPSVGYQGSQSSCVGWAFGYTAMGILTYPKYYCWSAAERSPGFVYNQIKLNTSCNSGSLGRLGADLVKTKGVCSYTLMPYVFNDCATQPNSTQLSDAAQNKAYDWVKLEANDVTGIKMALDLGFPVVNLFPVSPEFNSMWYNGNGIWNTNTNNIGDGHATCIIGYDDNKQMFKVQNQWGTSGGDNGYYWVTYDLVRNNCMQELYIVYGNNNSNLPSINGNDLICSSENFSINNLPANVSVSWSSVPSNVVSFSCTNCDQTTITQQDNYYATIQATLTDNCSGQVSTLYKKVTLGLGGSINFTQKTITCEGSRHYFYGAVEPRPFTTNYAWYAKDESNPNNPFVLYDSGPSNTADFPLGNGINDKYYTIKVIATNACGNKQSIIEEGLIFASSCSSGGGNLRIAASPNPANSIISVEIMDDSKDKLINKKEKIFEIQLLDKMGVTRKQIKYSGGMEKINISLDNMESNIYVLRVFNGKQWISKQIIKKQ